MLMSRRQHGLTRAVLYAARPRRKTWKKGMGATQSWMRNAMPTWSIQITKTFLTTPARQVVD